MGPPVVLVVSFSAPGAVGAKYPLERVQNRYRSWRMYRPHRLVRAKISKSLRLEVVEGVKKIRW